MVYGIYHDAVVAGADAAAQAHHRQGGPRPLRRPPRRGGPARLKAAVTPEEKNEISQKNSQTLTEKTSAESGSSKISDLREPEPEIVSRTEEREGSKISKICKYCY